MINNDGNLYYGSNPNDGGDMPPGGLSVSRMSTDGKLAAFAPRLKKLLAEINQGVTGLAAGPGGMIYVASPSAIYKVNTDGTVTPFVNPVVADDCDADPADHIPSNPLPYLRGLAVAADGTVYATIELEQLRAENERLTKTRANTPDRLNDAQLRELLQARSLLPVLPYGDERIPLSDITRLAITYPTQHLRADLELESWHLPPIPLLPVRPSREYHVGVGDGEPPMAE